LVEDRSEFSKCLAGIKGEGEARDSFFFDEELWGERLRLFVGKEGFGDGELVTVADKLASEIPEAQSRGKEFMLGFGGKRSHAYEEKLSHLPVLVYVWFTCTR
jgi:hypothetical protein